VVAAIVLLTVGLSVKARTPHAASRHPAAATLARSVAVGTSDLPTGWKAQATGTSPLAQLLPQGDGTGLAPGTPPPAATAASFASCLHRRTTNDVVVGPAGAHPIGRSTSQVFQSPLGGAAMGVATVTSVYRDAAEVRTAAGELTLPGFAHCLGTALGTELLKAAQSVPADAGATFGTLTISPLTLPQGHNVTAAGVDVSVPVTYPGGQTTVDVGFVLVAGGTVETTLVTYAAGGTFPSALSRSLAADLEDDVAASLT